MVSGTFSVLAISPNSKLMGVGATSGSSSVGDRVPHAVPGVGVVATQAYTNAVYGTKGLELMAKGSPPQEVLDKLLLQDSGKDLRQVAIMDFKGRKAVFTGTFVPEYCASVIGKDYVMIGNMLSRREVVSSMAEAFENSSGNLVSRIVNALKAGSKNGGDRRGEFSAALVIISGRNVEVKISVDSHASPVEELRRKLRTKR